MRFKIILKLAFKNLIERKMRSILTISAVGISIGSIVFLVSLGFGLQRASLGQIANIEELKNLDVTSGKSKIIEVNDAAVTKIKGIANVEEASPFSQYATKIKYKESEIEGIIYGKDSTFLKLEGPTLKYGSIYKIDASNEALLSLSAIKRLGINNPPDILGKEISTAAKISSDYLEDKSAKSLNADFKLKVVGIIDNSETAYLYTPLVNFTDLGVVKYSGLKVQTNAKENLPLVKKQIETFGFKTTSLNDTVAQINEFFRIFQYVLIGFGTIAIIVACLGMFNTLTITLLEKTREIGFMKAMGTTRKDINRLFFTESFLIGFLGGLTGIIGSYILGLSINGWVESLAKKTGNKSVELFYMPVEVILIAIGIAAVISLLTGFYPAFRASRINPLNALRYE
ncbi:hypothetical protein COZ22_00375 [bacterium (Candidatus Howlettbacteria) CG_4_10_14_3_um_filter_37_10]|nr:MAG: hypothetical protein COZ22_00375 [bacterium (Candidatus Howlettbacteria) CG_4_10_14_3_um_filter_37_10]